MNIRQLLKPIVAILAALVVTLVVGFHSGFPNDPEAFREHTEKLHRDAMAGSDHSGLVSEESIVVVAVAPNGGGFFVDLTKVLRWHAALFSLAYFVFLFPLNARVQETIFVSILLTLGLFSWLGIASGVLVAVAAGFYVFVRLMFRRSSKDSLSV